MKAHTPLLSTIVLFATATTLLATPIDGLVSYWPMDTADATSTPDLSFSNAMGLGGATTVPTIVGPTTNLSGFFSNAMQFDGTSSYLTNFHSPDNTGTGLPIYRGGSYTVAMWVKGAAQTAKYLYTEASTTSQNPLLLIQTGNAAANNAKLDINIRNDAGTTLVNHIVSASVVFNNVWHHIAFVDNRGVAKLYVDGVLDTANFNYTPAGTFTMDTTAIGTLVRALVSTGNIFNGQIDEVGVWERPLSQIEINQVRTNGIYGPGAQVPPRAATLTSVPASMTKNLGDWALFSVTGYGNRPLTYQWSRNGSPILDATNRIYQVTGLGTNNTGDYYSVAVINPGGTVTTTNAVLTVLDDPAPSLTNALVDYWPLDATNVVNGDLISPELHFGQNMVLKNFINNNELVAGQYSNSLMFDFVTTYGYRTNGTPIFNRTNYSVSLWVKADFTGQNDRRVFSEGSSINNNPLFTLGTDNTATTPSATVFVRNDTGANAELVAKKSARSVFDNNWHQLVWTDANGKGKLYVDGTLDETDYNYTRGALTLNQTSIGAVLRGAPGNYYFGNIDDVATWNRVLTWSEIQVLKTNGVPIPEGIVAPSITTQPPDRTNNVFSGDNVTFQVQVNGTLPLDYQWRKGGVPISGALNPSALTDTLILTNVQAADSNTTYSVVATNAAGSVTSSVVRLYVTPWTPVTNGEVLKVDFGLTGSPNPQPGFAEMSAFGPNPSTFANAVRVTVSAIGTSLAERNRIVAPWVVDNPPAMTQARLYNDFIFANSTGDGTGMTLQLDRLAPNTPYGITVWSFDPQSGGLRFSDWIETASATPVTITNGYTFDGTIQPTSDYGQTFGALLISSPTGRLQLEGRKNGGASFGVFLNAIRLVARPTANQIIRTELVGGILRIFVQGEYPGQPISMLQSTNLTTWTDTGSTPVATQGPIVIFEFPADGAQTFYRSLSYPTW